MGKNVALLLVLIFVVASSITFAKPALSSPAAITENSWVSKAPMHEARAYLGVAVVNGKIYAIGGDNGTYMGNVGNAWGRTNSIVNTNEEYDPDNDTWALKAPMPTARAGFAIAAYQNKIYCFGGWTEDYSNTNVNEVYDSSTDSWETKNPLPTVNGTWPSVQIANVVNGKIYISFLLSSLDVTYVYDPARDSWISKTPPLYRITGFTSAVIGTKMYFEGAEMANGTFKGSIQIYDTATDSWNVVLTFPASFDLYGNGGETSGVFAPTKTYFFMNNLTNIYDVANDSWTTGASMPTIRYSAGVAVVNDTFYVVGGRSGRWGYFVDMRASAVNEHYIPIGYGTIRPVVSAVSPENKTYNESSVPLTFTVDKPASLIEYSLDGLDNVTITGNTTLSGLSDGVHNVTVYAKADNGNVGASETITFTVNNKQEPFSTTVVVAVSGAFVAVVGFGLFWLFRKRNR